MKKTYVIIGNSAAGLAAANRLKELDQKSKIICISSEQEKPYNKCRLTDYLSGDKPEQSVFLGWCEYLSGNNFYGVSEDIQENGIEFIFGTKVEKIASHNNRVLLSNNKEITYDKILIATGAKPVRLNIKGANDAGTFVFHTLQDTNNILNFIKNNKPKKAVIIGSGMTGMECAGALHAKNIDVEIVEMGTHMLSGCCDKIGAEFIENAIYKKISGFSSLDEQDCDESSSCAKVSGASEISGQDGAKIYSQKNGLNINCNESVKEIISENGKISCVVLNSGKFIAADMVVFAVGVRAYTDLAKDVAAEVSEFGIVTNDLMNTNVANIYAGGDCAQVKDIVSGNFIRSNAWHDATTQGQIAAENMYLSGLVQDSENKEVACESGTVQNSEAIKYAGALPTSYSDIFGINFASYLGAINNKLKYEFVFDVGPNFYNKIWLQDGYVKGFVLIGDISKIGKLKRAINSGDRLEV